MLEEEIKEAKEAEPTTETPVEVAPVEPAPVEEIVKEAPKKEKVTPKAEDVASKEAPKQAPKAEAKTEVTPKEGAPKAEHEHAPHAEGSHAPHGETHAPRAEGQGHSEGRAEGASIERKPRGDAHHKGGAPRRDQKRSEEPKEFEERTVYINRVAKTVKGGRRMKFTALVVIGNHKGKYGFGLGKAAEVPDAIKKATENAKKNIYTIPMVKGGTIPHEITGHYGASKVFLKPAPEGTGIIAGGAVRAVLELSGITNVCSKVYGSKNSINVVKACHDGISHLTSYKQVKKLRMHTIETSGDTNPVVEIEEPEVKETPKKSAPKKEAEGGK